MSQTTPIAYADLLQLSQPVQHPEAFKTAQECKLAVGELLRHLRDETPLSSRFAAELEQRWPQARDLLRALLNIRPAQPMPLQHLQVLERLCWTERLQSQPVVASELPSVNQALECNWPHADQLVLWQGDITRLQIDAIVNAANSQMLGCFGPMHLCIDNAIHSAAGPRLRQDCATLMQWQGQEEATGTAKVTRAGQLPSRFVLHTVGPIVHGSLSPEHERLLASSYESCLDLASKVQAQDGAVIQVAFCCISTGVFGYPADDAAKVAVRTVHQWLVEHPNVIERVVFNVFSQSDQSRYERLFRAEP
jgi:O-acetyl-ADP-ribose deacetylase (regulator of RNase III)